jgi:hypothetical protein
MSTSYDPTPEGYDATQGGDGPHLEGYDLPEDSLPTAARRPSVLHLVLGLVFLGLAAIWALAASGTVGSDDTWLVPALLVVAGATGLVAALAASRRSGGR